MDFRSINIRVFELRRAIFRYDRTVGSGPVTTAVLHQRVLKTWYLYHILELKIAAWKRNRDICPPTTASKSIYLRWQKQSSRTDPPRRHI